MSAVSEFNKKVAAAVARSNVVDGERWPAYPEEEAELKRIIADLWLMAYRCSSKVSGVKGILGLAVFLSLVGSIAALDDESGYSGVFVLVLLLVGCALVVAFTQTSVRRLDSIPQELIGALLLTRRQLHWSEAVGNGSMQVRVKRELEAALRTKIFEHLLKLEQE